MAQIGIGQIVMILVCLGLLYLAIVKKFEPLLLVTIGFGGLLSNIPGVEIATGDCLLHLIFVLGLEEEPLAPARASAPASTLPARHHGCPRRRTWRTRRRTR